MEKLYLDTSIPGAYFDLSKPMRQLITQKWFEEKARYFDTYISTLTMTEIQKTKNELRRKSIKQLVQDTGSTLNIL